MRRGGVERQIMERKMEDDSFTEHRHNLLAGVDNILEACGYSETPDNNILQLLLYGNKICHWKPTG